jgi:hypothetical protein
VRTLLGNRCGTGSRGDAEGCAASGRCSGCGGGDGGSGAGGQVIRRDRILDEAHATGGDIRALTDLFGLTADGAMPYVITHMADQYDEIALKRHPAQRHATQATGTVRGRRW